jgi:DNA-binding NarL/FixJ family response regulator
MATIPGRIKGRTLTRARSQLVSDADWFRSSSYQEFRRPARLTHELTSILTTSADDAVLVISTIRASRDADYSARERRLVYFLHREIGRLLGGALVTETEPTPDGLPPRLHQTLACLVEGDGEKQIAARLGLSQATVHQYVTMLYRRFQVRSRAQLLAHVMRRLPHERWRGLVRVTR